MEAVLAKSRLLIDHAKLHGILSKKWFRRSWRLAVLAISRMHSHVYRQSNFDRIALVQVSKNELGLLRRHLEHKWSDLPRLEHHSHLCELLLYHFVRKVKSDWCDIVELPLVQSAWLAATFRSNSLLYQVDILDNTWYQLLRDHHVYLVHALRNGILSSES